MPSTAEQYLPPKLRAMGLAEGHTHPLVSRGKRDGRFVSSYRVPAEEAWKRYQSVELRSASAWTGLILDLDTPRSVRTLHEAVTGQEVPHPNWIVESRESGNCHVVWLYGRPVLRGEQAKRKPQLLAARVNEHYRERLKADPGFRSVLTHNPMPVHGGRRVTHWGNDEPYGLKQLAKVIPMGWQVPQVTTTGVGRNCSLFEAMLRWAGSPRNLGLDVLPAAIAANQRMDDPQGPLPHSEVVAIAKSVERYRSRWKFPDMSPKAIGERQRARQRRSVECRRAKNAERDSLIVEAYKSGRSQSDIARGFGLSQPGVRKIIQRDIG